MCTVCNTRSDIQKNVVFKPQINVAVTTKTNLTFCGPCIVIYLRNKDQQYELFFLNFISTISPLLGCGYMYWIGLAQDRDRWRTLLSAVMNLQVP